MKNTSVLVPNTAKETVNIPVVGPQAHRVTSDRTRIEIIGPREVKTTLFTKTWILLASVVLMFATCLLIAYLHLYKIFIKFKMPDPFHDSRKHPLNDPHAPRG